MSTRRDFLKRAAIFAAGGQAAKPLFAAIERAAAIDPADGSTFLDAEHVVILMQENRSFDHAFGTLRGVRGFNDPRAVTLPNQNPVWLQSNSKGETYAPFRLDLHNTKATWLGSLPHGWSDQTDARNHGNHDRWLDSKPSNRKECAGMSFTMGYYNREDIPFYYALADAFTICDQHFCSSLTGTTPNRLYLWTGTVREKQQADSIPAVRNSEVDEDSIAHWTTFPERLEDAGVSWKIYQNELTLPSGLTSEEDSWLANYGDNPIEWFEQYHADFSRNHRKHLDHLAASLPGEIEKLRQAPETPATKKELAAKETLLAKTLSDRKKYTDEAFAKLSDRERNLHAKAFTINDGDPNYRRLATHRYRDNGEERQLEIPAGDLFYQFRKDVSSGKLPTVSWLVAPEKLSDHPSAPWYGAWYVAEALDILTSNPEVWKKTIFILTYDENDGYFDHVPPFVAPDPQNPATGKTSPSVKTDLDYLPLSQDLTRQNARQARGGPIGLGYRVPLVVASPWSRGGYVCSQVFDHTSSIQLVEQIASRRAGRKMVESNISSWRRAVCGNLSSVFRPFDGDSARVPFPPRDTFVEGIYNARFKKMPTGYKLHDPSDKDWMPRQEPGFRRSNALPYELYADGKLSADRKSLEISLEAGNKIFGSSSAGSPFHVYTPSTFQGRTDLRTRAYAAAAGERVSDSWDLAGFENGVYHLRICGPNGFFRELSGTASDPELDIRLEYLPKSGSIRLGLKNNSAHAYKIEISAGAYRLGGDGFDLAPRGSRSVQYNLSKSHGWYEISVTTHDHFLRRYAGRLETGRESFSDPLMGRV